LTEQYGAAPHYKPKDSYADWTVQFSQISLVLVDGFLIITATSVYRESTKPQLCQFVSLYSRCFTGATLCVVAPEQFTCSATISCKIWPPDRQQWQSTADGV